MPLFEYLCESCGRRTEALQRLVEPPLAVCPHCQGKLRKLLSAPAFQFKGSGWYLTDYARKSGGGEKDGEAAKTGGEGASSAGESKSESTPASESASAPAAKPSDKGGD